MNEVQMKRGKKIKPNAIIDYNHGKGLIEQIGSYHTCLRKGVKWYRKIAFDIICNTALINAFSLVQNFYNIVIFHMNTTTTLIFFM